MRLFNFDFEIILIWSMVFFGGCLSSPPQPVEFQTPKSVATDTTGSENLIIEIKNKRTVHFSSIDLEGKVLNRDVKNELAELKGLIQEVIRKASGKENLEIALKFPASTKHKDYNHVIEALKANEIYTFSLITIPE